MGKNKNTAQRIGEGDYKYRGYEMMQDLKSKYWYIYDWLGNLVSNEFNTMKEARECIDKACKQFCEFNREFFKKEYFAIRCKTRDQAEQCLARLQANGIRKWQNGNEINEYDNKFFYGFDVIYLFAEHHETTDPYDKYFTQSDGILYTRTDFLKEEQKMFRPILDFKDIKWTDDRASKWIVEQGCIAVGINVDDVYGTVKNNASDSDVTEEFDSEKEATHFYASLNLESWEETDDNTNERFRFVEWKRLSRVDCDDDYVESELELDFDVAIR